MNKFLKIYLLASYFLLFSYIPVYSGNKEQILREFFKEEERRYGANIEILQDSYGDFNPIGGFADGRYKLEKYIIYQVDVNIYKINLVFVKKKGIFRYFQKVSYPVWYKNDIVVFLTPKGKYRFQIPESDIIIKKEKDGYIIRRRKRELRVDLPAPNIRGKVHLHLIFK